jgi:hypothetical protein
MFALGSGYFLLWKSKELFLPIWTSATKKNDCNLVLPLVG